MAKSEELSASVSTYVREAIERLRPQTLREALQHVDPDSIEGAKQFLTKGLISLLSRDDTARTINAILSSQIDRLADCAHWPAWRSRFETFDGTRQPRPGRTNHDDRARTSADGDC